MPTFADLDAQLTGRCAQSRKVANNTYLVRRGDDIAVKLHATDVVTFHPDGTLTLNSGGWFTVTTKERINRYLPSGICLSQIKGRWYLVYPGHAEYDANGDYLRWEPSDRPAIPYADGITLDPTTLSVVEGAADTSDTDAEDALNAETRKAIERYLKTTTADEIVRAFTHVAGDCWLCNGMLGEDRKTEPDHLLSHLTDHYVMYSLAFNAVAERGYRDPHVILTFIYDDAQRGQVDHFYTDALRKYLRRHLTVGAVMVR